MIFVYNNDGEIVYTGMMKLCVVYITQMTLGAIILYKPTCSTINKH